MSCLAPRQVLMASGVSSFFKVFNGVIVSGAGSDKIRLLKNVHFSTKSSREWKSYGNKKSLGKFAVLTVSIAGGGLAIGGYELYKHYSYKFLSLPKPEPDPEPVDVKDDSKPSEEIQSYLIKNFKHILDNVVKVSFSSWQGLLRNHTVPTAVGYVISENGEIITNSHLAHLAREHLVNVVLTDGRKYEGVIKYVDYDADLALVKVDSNCLLYLDLGSTKDLKSDAWVAVMRNPDSETDFISLGVVSDVPGKKNDLEYIHIKSMEEAQITGSLLFNTSQEVVGCNVMTFKTGISVATPVEQLENFLADSRQNLSLKHSPDNRYYLGMTYVFLTPEMIEVVFGRNKKIEEYLKGALYVHNVFPSTPAAKSGLQPGDVIFKVNASRFKSMNEFFNAADDTKTVTAHVYRNGTIHKLNVTPDNVQEA